jgi:hypothetical protein
MNTNEANEFVRSERARWLPGQGGSSDVAMLLQRERLLNGLTMLFALIALVSFFWAGVLGWGVWGWYFAVVGAGYTARQCSAHANRCREVRESLQTRP